MKRWARFIGAEQPPHLKALAPWEGLGDYYRESLCRGGIPDYSFWNLLLCEFQGGNQPLFHYLYGRRINRSKV